MDPSVLAQVKRKALSCFEKCFDQEVKKIHIALKKSSSSTSSSSSSSSSSLSSSSSSSRSKLSKNQSHNPKSLPKPRSNGSSSSSKSNSKSKSKSVPKSAGIKKKKTAISKKKTVKHDSPIRLLRGKCKQEDHFQDPFNGKCYKRGGPRERSIRKANGKEPPPRPYVRKQPAVAASRVSISSTSSRASHSSSKKGVPTRREQFETTVQAAADLADSIRQDGGISVDILGDLDFVLKSWDRDALDSQGRPLYHHILTASAVVATHSMRVSEEYDVDISDISNVEVDESDLLITNPDDVRVVLRGLQIVSQLEYNPDERAVIEGRGGGDAATQRAAKIKDLTTNLKTEIRKVMDAIEKKKVLSYSHLQILRFVLGSVGVPKGGPHTLLQRRALRLGQLLKILPAKKVTSNDDLAIIIDGLRSFSAFIVFADSRDAKTRKLQPLLKGDDFKTSSSGNLADEILTGTIQAHENHKKRKAMGLTKSSSSTKSKKSNGSNAELDAFLNTL